MCVPVSFAPARAFPQCHGRAETSNSSLRWLAQAVAWQKEFNLAIKVFLAGKCGKTDEESWLLF
jgi:hypothetical protein